MDKIYSFVLLMVSLVVCLLAPSFYKYEYTVLCVILFFINIFSYLLLKKKKNYFDFDCLFFITYFFVNLYYGMYMYETDPYRYVFYQLSFDKNTIPLSSGLALLGISAYIFGAMLVSEKKKDKIKNSLSYSGKKISNTWMYITSIMLFVVYVVTGGYKKLVSEYIGRGSGEIIEGEGIFVYFNVFFPAFLLSAIIVEFYNLKVENPQKIRFSKINKVGVVITVIVFLMFLLIGSRTLPLQIVLIILGFYALLYRPLGLIKFISSVVIGFVVMAFVRIIRSKEGEDFHIEDSAMDLIVNNRNTFLAVEIVQREDITYGISMLSPLFAPIPFAQSFIINITGINADDMRSALIFTKETFGYVGDWGLGTSIVADVYLAFGILGTFILFIGLGYFVNRARVNAQKSLFSLVLYGVLISYAVYLVRAEYLYFVRYFVWCSLIVLFGWKLQKAKKY
ncbi:O-antigen polysaccharide polymerase Wzy [Riemerella anatipestifer]|uniref:O-antigen polysaccharide polymerase Wzy n=1 Tax=Riemerella anatipestifer TaxID=34085 RepID=UPI00129E3222|nr:O-antigen polysaccharide polymerase Wzy [Riemerella anatipestifer]MRM83761.1 O-antigen polysaccharide polymerase Wzy [Riemerella anatipestifer]